MFIERLVQQPRHIEIQVLCDTHGNAVHLFERECSIQRRHQKVVEEAPSALLDDALRAAMGQCAIEVATCLRLRGGRHRGIFGRRISRVLLPRDEHPPASGTPRDRTDHGVDLVKEQIRIAEGHPMSFSQDDLSIQGHALELRVYAEDVPGGFLAKHRHVDTGTAPPVGAGVRVDDGVAEGGEVSMHYDPMLAKLCTHGPTREAAIERMLRAIDDYEVHGVDTTLDFGHFRHEPRGFPFREI